MTLNAANLLLLLAGVLGISTSFPFGPGFGIPSGSFSHSGSHFELPSGSLSNSGSHFELPSGSLSNSGFGVSSDTFNNALDAQKPALGTLPSLDVGSVSDAQQKAIDALSNAGTGTLPNLDVGSVRDAQQKALDALSNAGTGTLPNLDVGSVSDALSNAGTGSTDLTEMQTKAKDLATALANNVETANPGSSTNLNGKKCVSNNDCPETSPAYTGACVLQQCECAVTFYKRDGVCTNGSATLSTVSLATVLVVAILAWKMDA